MRSVVFLTIAPEGSFQQGGSSAGSERMVGLPDPAWTLVKKPMTAMRAFGLSRRLTQLRRLGRSTGYFRGAAAQKRESNQRRLVANRL
jgi:hypothetical protein